MKLRLAKDSVRLRLLRSEVKALASGSRLQETLTLGPDPTAWFTYEIEGCAGDGNASVKFLSNAIVVSLPLNQIHSWAVSDEVGIYTQIQNGTPKPIQLIVEKDFACLDRDEAANADTYQNPKMTC